MPLRESEGGVTSRVLVAYLDVSIDGGPRAMSDGLFREARERLDAALECCDIPPDAVESLSLLRRADRRR